MTTVKRLLLAALLLALPASAQWQRVDRGWVRVDAYNPNVLSGTGAAGQLGIFSGTKTISGFAVPAFSVATGTLSVFPGALTTGNVTATGLATPTVSSVNPQLTKVGSITTVAGSALVDGDHFTVNDGGAYVFEFDTGDGVTAGRTAIVFAGTETADEIRDLVVIKVNATCPLLTATAGGAATVSLAMKASAVSGGTNSETVTDAGFAITGMVDPTAATAYSYKVAAKLIDGTHTAASSAGSTAAGYLTLSASNFNNVVWGAVSNAAGYDVYRTIGGATQGKIGSTTSGVSLADTGLPGGGETAPTTNTTGLVAGDRLQVGTSATAGAVLTADASGVGTWQTPHSASYGGLYENSGGSAITVTTAGTYYGWTTATAGTVAGAGYVTADVADATGDNLLIGASGAGTYFVALACSYSTNQDNRTVEGAVFKNTSEALNIEWKRKAAVSGDIGSVSAQGFLALAAGDKVSFRLTSSTNGDVVTVKVVNLTIHRVN